VCVLTLLEVCVRSQEVVEERVPVSVRSVEAAVVAVSAEDVCAQTLMQGQRQGGGGVLVLDHTDHTVVLTQ
jgi:hypothetical protein